MLVIIWRKSKNAACSGFGNDKTFFIIVWYVTTSKLCLSIIMFENYKKKHVKWIDRRKEYDNVHFYQLLVNCIVLFIFWCLILHFLNITIRTSVYVDSLSFNYWAWKCINHKLSQGKSLSESIITFLAITHKIDHPPKVYALSNHFIM